VSTASGQSTPLVVEFPLAPGLQPVSRTAEDLAARSAEAMDNAMAAIQDMAARVRETADALASRPDSLQVQFGIKLTAEAGAIISKVSGEAALQVTLAWTTRG
jgi:hypothetical protein